MQDTNTLVEILTDIVKRFTRFHDDLKVNDTQPTQNSLVITFQPHADDMGKLIGEGGCMINALKEVAQQMGDSLSLRVKVEVQEPHIGKKMFQDSFKHNPKYVLDPELKNLEAVGKFIFNDSAKVEFTNDNGEKTTLVLLVDGDQFDYESELAAALNVIFRAIGLSIGRKLSVKMDTL